MIKDKILLVFSTHEESATTCETLNLNPVYLTDTITETPTFYLSVVEESETRIDVIDELYQRYYTRCKRVVIVDRQMLIPADRISPCYFPVKRAFELEQGMDMVWTNEQRNKIKTRVMNVERQIIHNVARSLITQLLTGGLMFLHQPEEVEEERTPLTTTWEDRLKTPTAKRSKKNCVICLENDPVVMLAPCMHQCVCDVCAKELMERNDQRKKCPLCRGQINDLFRPIK